MPKVVVLSTVRLASGEIWFEARHEKGNYVLDWKRAGCFFISKNSKRVKEQLRPGARRISLEIVRRLVRLYAASLHGEESLHATVLARNNQAIALFGNSGEGKSTLAVRLIERGWKLVSDDAFSITFRKRQVLVRHGTPQLKLSNGAVRHVPNFTHKEFDPNLEKWILRFPTPNATFHLKAVFILSRNGRGAIQMKRIRGIRATLAFQASFYNGIFRPHRVLHQQFDLAARLAQCLPLWKMRYPSGFEHLHTAVQKIESYFEASNAE